MLCGQIWPLLFYDFQEFSAVIICCSHSCFKINLHSANLSLSNLRRKRNPISTKSIAKKRRKMSFILHNVVPNDFNTVADFEVFLLNWKNGKWRHQDAGLRRSVLSKSFVPLSYWVFSFNFETINIPKFGTPEQIRIDQTLWNTNDNLRPVPWWCHVPFFQYR